MIFFLGKRGVIDQDQAFKSRMLADLGKPGLEI